MGGFGAETLNRRHAPRARRPGRSAFPEVPVVITPDTTADELAECARHLAKKRAACEDRLMRAEMAVELDALMDAWLARVKVER